MSHLSIRSDADKSQLLAFAPNPITVTESVNFKVNVSILHINQRCQLPQQAMLSVRIQIGTERRCTRTFPFRRELMGRDSHLHLNEEMQIPCTAHKNSTTNSYSTTHCRIILLTRYEMYGKHGYKTLAWESLPLHDLLPELLSQSHTTVNKTVSFDILSGVCVDLCIAANIVPKLSEESNEMERDLQHVVGSPMSLLTEGSDVYSLATAQSRQLRIFSTTEDHFHKQEIDSDVVPAFTVTEPSGLGVLSAAVTSDAGDSPAEPQYYQTADYSSFLQDELDLGITQHDVDVHFSGSPPYPSETAWYCSVAVQTETETTSPHSNSNSNSNNTDTDIDIERFLEEHTVAYLELTQENDTLLQNLIGVKMEYATLSNEVDTLRKYNYTLEQRLLQFYRRSDEVL